MSHHQIKEYLCYRQWDPYQQFHYHRIHHQEFHRREGQIWTKGKDLRKGN